MADTSVTSDRDSPKKTDFYPTLPTHTAKRQLSRNVQTTTRCMFHLCFLVFFTASLYSVFVRSPLRSKPSNPPDSATLARVHELELEVAALRFRSLVKEKEDVGRSGLYPDLMNRPGIQDAIMNRIEVGDQQSSRLTTRVLPLIEPDSWRQHSFSMHGAYGFVQFSGYRASASSFVVVGLALSALNPVRKLQGCYWTPNGGGEQIAGKLSIYYEGMPMDMQYEAVVLNCALAESKVPRGGYLVAQIDNEEWVALKEDGQDSTSFHPGGPYQHNLAYCSTSLHGEMLPEAMYEFIEYHRLVADTSHFYLYDAGAVDNRTRAVLKRHVEGGLITITDLRMALLFSVKLWGLPLTFLDCIQRTRYTAKWIFVGDMDEYLHVAPPNTISQILSKYEGRPFLTHGAYDFNISICERGGGENDKRFVVERMVTWTAEVHCVYWDKADNETYSNPETECIDCKGHRKYFVDPRQVLASSMHTVYGVKDGVHMNAITEIRQFHYRGMTSRWFTRNQCTLGAAGVGVKTNEDLAVQARAARQCPLGSPENCYREKLQEIAEEKKGAKEENVL